MCLISGAARLVSVLDAYARRYTISVEDSLCDSLGTDNLRHVFLARCQWARACAGEEEADTGGSLVECGSSRVTIARLGFRDVGAGSLAGSDGLAGSGGLAGSDGLAARRRLSGLLLLATRAAEEGSALPLELSLPILSTLDATFLQGGLLLPSILGGLLPRGTHRGLAPGPPYPRQSPSNHAASLPGHAPFSPPPTAALGGAAAEADADTGVGLTLTPTPGLTSEAEPRRNRTAGGGVGRVARGGVSWVAGEGVRVNPTAGGPNQSIKGPHKATHGQRRSNISAPPQGAANSTRYSGSASGGVDGGNGGGGGGGLDGGGSNGVGERGGTVGGGGDGGGDGGGGEGGGGGGGGEGGAVGGGEGRGEGRGGGVEGGVEGAAAGDSLGRFLLLVRRALAVQKQVHTVYIEVRGFGLTRNPPTC